MLAMTNPGLEMSALNSAGQTTGLTGTARKREILGFWAARAMGLYGYDARIYVDGLLTTHRHENADEELLYHIGADLSARGVGVNELVLRRALLDADRRTKAERFAAE